jgi:uncharacterized protein YrrD
MEANEPDTSKPDRGDMPADEAGTQTETSVAYEDLGEWRGRDLIDRDGQRIGKLQDVYFDIETDEPQFGTVKEGFLDHHFAFVPLTAVTVGPDRIQVPVTRQQVKGDELSQADESALYHHYEMNYTPSHNPSGRRLARH